MANLTKQDIKEVFVEALEPFAQAIQEDSAKTREDIKNLDTKFTERFNKVDDDINYIHGHLALIEEKLDKKVDQETVHSLSSRVAELEAKAK